MGNTVSTWDDAVSIFGIGAAALAAVDSDGTG
jgi:hypothetical protein